MAVAHRAQAIAAFLCQGLKLSRAIPASGFPSILATSMAEKSAPAAVLLHPRPPSLVVVRYTAASGPSACAVHSLLTLRYTHRATHPKSELHTLTTLRCPHPSTCTSARKKHATSSDSEPTCSSDSEPTCMLEEDRNGGGWLFVSFETLLQVGCIDVAGCQVCPHIGGVK